MSLSLSGLGGCANYAPAPVVNRDNTSAVAKRPVATVNAVTTVASSAESRANYYTVKKGDTLYSVALDNGQDYKDIASWNNIDNPNLIKIGQQLKVSSDNGAPVVVIKPVTSDTPVEVKSGVAGKSAASGATDALKREPKGGTLAYSDEALARARQAETAGSQKPLELKADTRLSGVKTEVAPPPKPVEPMPVAADDVDWAWPAKGKMLSPFSEGGSKGIDIAGKMGDPVLAAASGVVSYAGAGLRGYGNLVVVRHNATYLSVYAHNSKVLVKEKQSVTKGQKIAEMGSTDAESPRLHFEVRRMGKPVDPQKFLPGN